MTMQEIEKSLRDAILQLTTKAPGGGNAFDIRARKHQLRDLIKDLKRRRKEILEQRLNSKL